MHLLSGRLFWFNGFLLTLFLVGVSFWLENYAGVIPCPLCLLQRFTFITMGVFFLLGTFFDARIWHIMLGSITSLLSLTGVLLSGRQVWLQYLPQDQQSDCGVSLTYLFKILPPSQALSKILEGSTECARVAWKFLSLSLAEWSLIFFVLFLIFSLIHLRMNFLQKSRK
ncbi:MAG: disulfide bond formation protein B [Gammaproteobacteria bacterium]|nr:disulfide bond formation protein B [Gammaproteobacteria bacterium]